MVKYGANSNAKVIVSEREMAGDQKQSTLSRAVSIHFGLLSLHFCGLIRDMFGGFAQAAIPSASRSGLGQMLKRVFKSYIQLNLRTI